jgi:hypothetical protein
VAVDSSFIAIDPYYEVSGVGCQVSGKMRQLMRQYLKTGVFIDAIKFLFIYSVSPVPS